MQCYLASLEVIGSKIAQCGATCSHLSINLKSKAIRTPISYAHANAKDNSNIKVTMVGDPFFSISSVCVPVIIGIWY